MPFSYWSTFRLKMTPYSLCYNERTKWQTRVSERLAKASRLDKNRGGNAV